MSATEADPIPGEVHVAPVDVVVSETNPQPAFQAPAQSVQAPVAQTEPDPVAPEPAPVETPEEQAALAQAETVARLRENEKIDVVAPGDSDGFAALAVRMLGMGDSGTYEGQVVEVVKARQEAAGLEPDGIIAGPTWALIMRPIKRGDSGLEVVILKALLGVRSSGTTFDDELVDAVGGTSVNGDLWRNFIENGAPAPAAAAQPEQPAS